MPADKVKSRQLTS